MKTVCVGWWSIGSLAWCAMAVAAPAPVAPLPPLPTGFTTLPPPVAADHFTFVVGGDNRSTGHGVPMPPSFAEICREAGFLGPDLVMWTGDTIEGYGDTPAEAAAEYRTFLAGARLCRVPFFNIPGNHEKGLKPDAAALQAVYLKMMGPLYGSFDYGNSHFIGLDTTTVVDDAAEGGAIDATQLAWLQRDLAEHAGKAANIFVFMHHYMYGMPNPALPQGADTGFDDVAARDRLHALFVKYGVRAVFCGHAHMYRHVAHDGIDYFIAGNAGAPFDAPPEDGGFLGYMLITVDGTLVTHWNLQPWTLFVRPLAGGDGKAARAVLEVDNYTGHTLTARGITVSMPTGHRYTVVAESTYAKRSRSVAATIVSWASGGAGKIVTLKLQVELPPLHTTHLEILPVAP